MSSSDSSHEEFLPGPSEVEHVSESSSSTAAQTGQEQRTQGRMERRQRDDLIENDLLISLVQERVPLWDTRDPLHSNNVTIRRLWNEVAKEMWDGWDNAPTRVRKAFGEKSAAGGTVSMLSCSSLGTLCSLWSYWTGEKRPCYPQNNPLAME
ncbi:uncharacterized protein LOC143805121 [Ranitomeya variabilis]|uniref:uncharacterized protein LOC143805121 n=1 Tax=Ranitomeya variabilis TaxID=490064 RepID=UPI004057B4B4